MSNRRIFVIGHRNPDTDSVVSAIAYAYLKRQQGLDCQPARAGRLTPQTEYVLKRFGVPFPAFVPDLQPKVRHFLEGEPVTLPETASLWQALGLMDSKGLSVLPVTDGEGRYRSMLNHLSFARNMTRKINPKRKAVVPTSVDLLVNTLNAQPIVTFNASEVVKSRILVAASSPETFAGNLDREIPANAIVLVGDRVEVMERVIASGARVLVLTNGTSLPPAMRKLAEEHRVSVIVSAYDTSSTAFLVLYSTPVKYMTDLEAKPVNAEDAVRDIRAALAASPSRCLPVVDRDNRVVGVFAERDLVKEPNTDIIMVDHNELSLAVEGIDQFRILEIIDHHKLGNQPTRQPVTFINKVVGSTATIVASLFEEQRVALTPQVAGILLSGILADTLGLRSATTTDADRNTANNLADLLNLDIDEFAKDLFANSSHKGDWTVEEMLSVDAKNYEFSGRKFAVAQVESGTADALVARHVEILKGLERQCKDRSLAFSALMITDITALNSVLLAAGDQRLIASIPFPKLYDRTWLCRGILSRKKQLLPLLMEQLETVYGR